MNRYALLVPGALLVIAAVILARVVWQLARELQERAHAADAVATRPDLIAVECADPIPASHYNSEFIPPDSGVGYHRREDLDRA